MSGLAMRDGTTPIRASNSRRRGDEEARTRFVTSMDLSWIPAGAGMIRFADHLKR